MAIAEAAVVATNNLSGLSGVSTAFTPVTGQWYKVWVINRGTGADAPVTVSHPSFSSLALITGATQTYATSRRISTYAGYCDQAPSSAGVTVDFGAETQDSITIRVKTYTGMHASAPVVQKKVGTGSSTTPNVTFDAPTTVGNAVAGIVSFASDSATFTWDSTMADTGNSTSGNSQATRSYTGFIAGQEDSPSGVISSTLNWAEIAIEIAAAAAGGVALAGLVDGGSTESTLFDGGLVQ